MSRFALCRLASLGPLASLGLLASLVAAGPGTARAQFTAIPPPPYFAVNPPSGGTPLQQQQVQNYRSQLLQAQSELARQNPSGWSREQIEVARQLNAFDPALNPAPAPPATTAAPLMPSPAPFR